MFDWIPGQSVQSVLICGSGTGDQRHNVIQDIKAGFAPQTIDFVGLTPPWEDEKAAETNHVGIDPTSTSLRETLEWARTLRSKKFDLAVSLYTNIDGKHFIKQNLICLLARPKRALTNNQARISKALTWRAFLEQILLVCFLNKISFLVYRFFLSFMKILLDATTLFARSYRALVPPKKRERSAGLKILAFSHYPNEIAGTVNRVHNWKPLMEELGYGFDIVDGPGLDRFVRLYENGNKIQRYYFASKILFSRFFHVLRAFRYDIIYIHRGLYPYYPKMDWAFPRLQRLLHAINPRIMIDFYDADYVLDEEYILETIRFARHILVVNSYLKNYFSRHHDSVSIMPLMLDPTPYIMKEDYHSSAVVSLGWMGQFNNFDRYMSILFDVFGRLKEKTKFRIVIVCRRPCSIPGVETIHERWSDEDFYTRFRNFDIALCPNSATGPVDFGKVAGKFLQYAACGVPIVATPVGIPEGLEDGEHFMEAKNPQEWEDKLLCLIEDAELREKIGRGGRRFLEENLTHSRNLNRFIAAIETVHS